MEKRKNGMPDHRYIDLRSDSVTQPTPEMRKAMSEAEVGYDVLRDDPTTARLERLAAEMTGMEEGLFVPTGTLCNQLSILSFTERGDEIILSEGSHITESELGAAAVISGVNYRIVPTGDGILRAADISRAVREKNNVYSPRSGLICMENALGRGAVVPLDLMAEAYAAAKEHGLPVYTDGARVFNACAALGCDIDRKSTRLNSNH
jgi:threonine aldolase